MRFLLRAIPREIERPRFLGIVRSLAQNLGMNAVNPKWTSYGALEIDIFANNASDFQTLVAAIEPLARIELARNLQDLMTFPSKEAALNQARSMFNAERYWEAHEVLESIWRVSEGEEKKLLQGLILVCAAFVHAQKDENAVALGIAKRALPHLAWRDRSYYGIDVLSLSERMKTLAVDGTIYFFRL